MKIIDDKLICDVVEQAKQSPRLRMRSAQTKMLPLITYLCSLSQIFGGDAAFRELRKHKSSFHYLFLVRNLTTFAV